MTQTAKKTNPEQSNQPDDEQGKFLASYDASKYERPSITVDMVIFTIRAGDLKVLLIQRGGHPYQGMWAIPGGFVKMDESLEDGAKRELQEETAVQDVYMEQLYTFGDPGRDPRTRVISVAYFALVEANQVKTIQAGSDAQQAEWFSMYALPPLAFDHAKILDYALTRLRYKLEYTNVAFALLPATFTLTELQHIYEIILHKALDKRNFRKKILAMEMDERPMLEETSETKMEGSHRPARLYRFLDRIDRIVRGFR